MATGSTSDTNFEKFDFDSVTTSSNYIDRGAFGEVYGPFTWNSRKCAFKRIWISAGRPGDDFKIKVEAKRNIWTSLKHTSLIEIHNVILRPNLLYIVMEYASGGSLRRLLDNYDVTVQIDVSNWATQIAEGMLYLHEKNIVHRDLKSNNIMLMDPFESVCPRKEMTLKITDFDDVSEHNRTTTMSLKGTVAYTAPEVLKTERFSKASDVWSYGVVVWEMLTGGHPYEDVVDGAIMLKALTGQLTLSVPESIPKSYKELLCGCLHQDKDRRPSFEGIIVRLNTLGMKEDKCRSICKSDPALVWMIRTKASEEENKWISGLTILDRELFIVSDESSEIEVYDLMKFSFSRRWNLKELINPLDMVSCDRNKCLYILDCKNRRSNEILRVDPNGILIKNWSAEDAWGWGLSVTYDSNIILTVCYTNKLNEYSPEGQLLREINLSSDADIRHPSHAIKLTNGHFVVSHGFDGDERHRVCLVDADGKLQKSFGGKWGSTIGQLKEPVYLSVDGNGFVIVADYLNSRVLLLDSDLEFKREILSKEQKQGLQRPCRILMDDSNGRLFVADNERNNQRIKIFCFK